MGLVVWGLGLWGYRLQLGLGLEGFGYGTHLRCSPTVS